jgi:hypothetical protein
MAKRIQETKQYMIQLTDNQLELTTKRTIMENEQMSAEIAYQSHQTDSILAQNRVLDKRLALLRRELTLSRATQEELSKRNIVYQRAIKHLVRGNRSFMRAAHTLRAHRRPLRAARRHTCRTCMLCSSAHLCLCGTRNNKPHPRQPMRHM